MIEGLVIRYGEIFLKGKNRPVFERRFLRNIRMLLRDEGGEYEKGQGRIYIRNLTVSETKLQQLSRLFGLASVSPVWFIKNSFDDICKAAKQVLKDAAPEAKTFKIVARRSDKQFPLTSPELNTKVGSYVALETDYPISIPNPEVEIGIEVGKEDTFVFHRTLPGAGGLPVGSSGKAALLLSGGIDSPVAGYLAMKRGSPICAIYFHSPPYTGEGAKKKVKDLCQKLVIYHGDPIDLYVVPFTKTQEVFRDKAPSDMLVVLYRRQMLRIAQEIAKDQNALALVTGESVGQVASQTLENLSCIDEASQMLILRPLSSFDKKEAVSLAKEIGTFSTSILPHDDCCSLFVPKHPKTRAKLIEVYKAEENLPLEDLQKEAIQNTEHISISIEED